MNYTIVEASTGKVTCNITCPEDLIAMQFDVTTHFVTQGNYSDNEFYYDTEFKQFPSKPNIHCIFNYTNKQWEDPRTLQHLKSAKNLWISTSRLKANQLTFTFTGKQIAVDPLSRGDIDAVHGIVVLTNEMPEGWVGGWKAIDNTFVSIPNVSTWSLFYKAMVGQGSINFAHAQHLKAKLAAATTIEEVDAIVW